MKEEKIAPGISIVGFDDAQEALDYMSDQELQSIMNALDEQWRISWGSWVLRIVDELWIFGYIFTSEELVKELQEGAEEADLHESLYELRHHQESYDRGYRYGRYHSVVVPDGEYGNAHVAALWEITKQDFEEARRNDWKPIPHLAFRVGQEVGEAVKKKKANEAADKEQEEQEE